MFWKFARHRESFELCRIGRGVPYPDFVERRLGYLRQLGLECHGGFVAQS